MNNNELKCKQLPYNFQLWLVACLIKINDFEDAGLIIGAIWGEKLDLTINFELLSSLFWYTETIIHNMYIKLP